MKKFIQQSGATVFVSHSAEQVRQVCDTVIVMNKGKIGFMGPVEAGIDYYQTTFSSNS
jgi:ABC-type polysaccharide/polyol phosphate transport system ATPase subunit